MYLFHVVLERSHFSQLSHPIFWKTKGSNIIFNDDNGTTKYVHKLQDAILAEFPPDEKKEGYHYGKDYYAK
jgi:hypothetical protein